MNSMDENPTQPPGQSPIQPSVPVKPALRFPLILLIVVGLAIAGYFASAYYFTLWPFEQAVAPVPTFTPRPSMAVKAEDISTWKIYRDENNGFEFPYPKNWIVEITGNKTLKNSLLIGPSGVDDRTFIMQALSLDISDSSKYSSLKDFAEQQAGREHEDVEKITLENTLINNIPAIKIHSADKSNYTRIVFFYGEKAFLLYDSGSLENESNEFKNILSTFKFIKLGQVNVSNLEPDSFAWCIANGGDDRTPNYNAPKVCVLTNKVYEENCVSNTKYFVIESNLTDSVGANHLVKFKTSENQNFDCKYVVEKGDFEIKNEWAEYALALENNFLILDSGTGPDPRGLVVYDLNLRKKIYEDSYSQPINIQNNIVDYWTGTTKPVTEQNCPEFKQWEEGGSGSAIDAHVSLNLSTLVKKELGEYRCSARQ